MISSRDRGLWNPKYVDTFMGGVVVFRKFMHRHEDKRSWALLQIVRAFEFPREYDGACLQMRLSYSPTTHLFLFLVQWIDYSLAGALGRLRILIYKVYVDGTTTMSTHE
ncbi:hypothetical protein SUGI_0999030 [Cryptomeria japonica]|nr:hypothetical protein SUGI_0999030 [Cryptomeria japonica]